MAKRTEDKGLLGCEAGRFVGRQVPTSSSNLLCPFSVQLVSSQTLVAACLISGYVPEDVTLRSLM
jgi:hypothetical protein